MRTKTRENAFAAGGGGRIALLIVTAGMLIELMVPITAWAEPCTPTPVPSPEPCPSSSLCQFVTPSATPLARPADPFATPVPPITPTPVVTPTPAYYSGAKFLEAQYASFGNRWSQRPQTDKATTFQFLWGIPMSYNTRVSTNTTHSIYSPLVSQALYWDNLWDASEQKVDFADRTQHFLGSFASSAISLESGPNKTRNSSTGGSETDQKYAIGEVHLGMALRGGAFDRTAVENQDQWNVLGSANFGMASIADHNTFESVANQPWERRIHLNQITGSENAAWLSRAIRPRLTDTTKPGPIDLREGYWHEDSTVNLVPADVASMLGTSNLIFLDNKKGDYCSVRQPPDYPRQGGYVDVALANRALICAFTKGSWVNANITASYEGSLIVWNSFNGSPGWFCGTGGERLGSTIRSYTGINILAPTVTSCDPIHIRTARAFSFYDFSPLTGGGAAPLVAGNVDEKFRDVSVEPEKYGAFVRGSMVVGDSQGGSTRDSGYDTDVLHVRDVIHLTPRSEPPKFDENLPPSERVGLLYFDLARNTLRVSVAAQNSAFTEKEDWKNAEVVWVDLALNIEAAEPIMDVVGGEKSADSLAYKSIETLKDSMELAKVAAIDGTSPYLHPKLEIAGPVMTDAATVSFTVLCSGLGADAPNVYWRLQSVGENQQRIETPWKQMTEAELSPVAGLDSSAGAAVVILTPQAVGQDGEPVPLECSGKVLQLFAINSTTGQSCGTSVKL